MNEMTLDWVFLSTDDSYLENIVRAAVLFTLCSELWTTFDNFKRQYIGLYFWGLRIIVLQYYSFEFTTITTRTQTKSKTIICGANYFFFQSDFTISLGPTTTPTRTWQWKLLFFMLPWYWTEIFTEIFSI